MGALRHDLDNYLQASNVSLQFRSLKVRACKGYAAHSAAELMCSTQLQPQSGHHSPTRLLCSTHCMQTHMATLKVELLCGCTA